MTPNAHKTNAASVCRSCGHKQDAATGLEHSNPPEPSDLCVCGYCGTLSQYDEALDLKPLTPELLAELNDHQPETFDLMMKASKYIREHNPLAEIDKQCAREVKKYAPGNCAEHGHVPDGNGFCFRCGQQLGEIEIVIKG